MKILLHLFLLFGAMTGLLGHSTALAMAPAVSVSMSGLSDCADMADGVTPDDLLCKKITWHCAAAMNCAPVAIALPTKTAEAAPSIIRIPHVRPIVPVMLGRSVAPELDPPALPI